MFMLKLLLELSALGLLAFFLRKVITRALPTGDAQSSSAPLHGEWQWYSTIYVVLGIILSIISFWVVYGLFYILHSLDHYSGVLVVSQGGLLVPSLIFGFYGSTVFSRYVYLDLFGMNAAIFEDGVMMKRDWQGLFKKFFSVFSLGLGFLLLVFQYNVYLKTDGENIYARKLGEPEKVYAVGDIQRVAAPDARHTEIYLNNGDVLSTSGYSGNMNYFLDNISQ